MQGESAVPQLDGPRWGPKSGGTPKQLVVLCHGLGADGMDLIDLAPGWGNTLPDAAFVAPDAPEECDMGPFGRQWFSVQDRSEPMRLAGVRAASAVLDAFIDAELARLGLPADAYALMGFSQGAMTCLFAGLRRVVGPRVIMAYSGGLIAPETLSAEMKNKAPVLLVHGEDDPVVLVNHSTEAAAALAAAGVKVDMNFRPFLEHGIDEEGIDLGAAALKKAFGGM
jgi:phospholipase/carboxylesterase